ncbi:MAG TPA: hypothetical protein VIR02_14955 [Anaerolineales bacterium]
MPEGNGRRKLPQVADTETPRQVDAAGKCLVYDETGVHVPGTGGAYDRDVLDGSK